jgi:hypothetical protein
VSVEERTIIVLDAKRRQIGSSKPANTAGKR